MGFERRRVRDMVAEERGKMANRSCQDRGGLRLAHQKQEVKYVEAPVAIDVRRCGRCGQARTRKTVPDTRQLKPREQRVLVDEPTTDGNDRTETAIFGETMTKSRSFSCSWES